MKLQVTPAARNDLKEIRAYITNELMNPQAAINVVKRITTRIRSLMDFPALGAPLSSVTEFDTDYRFLICGNYMAFYRFDDRNVYILRILYGRRDFIKILFGISTVSGDEIP